MRSFEEIARSVGTDKASHGYHVFYERHFSAFRGRPLNFLEVGVQNGFSLRLWEEFFPSAKIYGIDIDPASMKASSDRSKVFIGDQGDMEFLSKVVEEIGLLDIVVDDAGHVMDPQQACFLGLMPHVRPGGFYVIEDLQTSYFPHCGGGGPGAKGTTVSMLKSLVDDINVDSHGGRLIVPTKISEMHFYKNITFLVRE